jgi:hypothetical protein
LTYELVYQLSIDPAFNNRVRSCMYEQAQTYQSNPDPATAALAKDVMRGSGAGVQSMIGMIAAFPGMTNAPVTITKGDGSVMVDQTAVTDETVLSQVQANWETVANLFYMPPPSTT